MQRQAQVSGISAENRMLIFLTGDLKDWVKLNIKYDVGSCFGAYTESLIKIRHELAEKDSVGGWRMLRVPDWRLGGWSHI